jgi:hypothetical protein
LLSLILTRAEYEVRVNSDQPPPGSQPLYVTERDAAKARRDRAVAKLAKAEAHASGSRSRNERNEDDRGDSLAAR